MATSASTLGTTTVTAKRAAAVVTGSPGGSPFNGVAAISGAHREEVLCQLFIVHPRMDRCPFPQLQRRRDAGVDRSGGGERAGEKGGRQRLHFGRSRVEAPPPAAMELVGDEARVGARPPLLPHRPHGPLVLPQGHGAAVHVLGLYIQGHVRGDPPAAMPGRPRGRLHKRPLHTHWAPPQTCPRRCKSGGKNGREEGGRRGTPRGGHPHPRQPQATFVEVPHKLPSGHVQCHLLLAAPVDTHPQRAGRQRGDGKPVARAVDAAPHRAPS